MAERYGNCERCAGRGKTLIKREVLEKSRLDESIPSNADPRADQIQRVTTVERLTYQECGRCEGLGHSGDATKAPV